MAHKHLEQPHDFKVDVRWPEMPTGGGIPLLDASVGRLSIFIQDTCVTAYQSDKGDTGTELTMPLYNIVEWITSNWWALLFEPRKNEQIEHGDDDFGYRSRHWLGFARDGFALPDLWFFPVGDEIELAAYEKYLRFARLTFLNSATAAVPTEDVRNVLRVFIDDTLRKMADVGIRDTIAHEMWARICSTGSDAEQYCRLIGSLGLSPYEEHKDIDRIIDLLADRTPASILADLFEVSDDSNLPSMARLAEKVCELLPKSREINIEALAKIEVPIRGPQPWQWGKEAARKARTYFGITAQDQHGGDAFFEKLAIDPTSIDLSGLEEGPSAAKLSGGMKRDDVTLRMALGESQLPRRRFAAARGVFMGWSSGDHSSHLITSARTRQQQAARAFAAELLAPFEYIRRRAGGSNISMYRIEEIATELGVSPAVVKWQAHDNRLHVVDVGHW